MRATACSVRRLLLAGVLLVGVAAAASGNPSRERQSWRRGQWFIDNPTEDGKVQFSLRVVNDNDREERSESLPQSDLQGLSHADLAGAESKQASFDLHRDAGTFHCRGDVHGGQGGGTFELALDPAFPVALERRGIGRPSEDQQIEFAFEDMGFAFLDELNAQHYPRPTLDQLVALGEHAVNTRFVREMGEAGMQLGSLDRLLQARDHGVTPRFAREIREAGLGRLTYEELLTARDHGVSPHYIADMKAAGFEHLELATLLMARDHGVTARYIQELADNGYRNVPLPQLIRARDHGVNAAWVRKVHDRLGHDVTLDELIMMHDRGEIVGDAGR